MACFFKKKVLLSNTFLYWSFFRQYFIPKKISQYLQTTFLLYLQRLQVIVPLTFF
nr:MAG TPA: hypothetical protein [Caudoviricetes sp.]